MTINNPNTFEDSIITTSINILNKASDPFSSLEALVQVYYAVDSNLTASEIAIGSPTTIGLSQDQTLLADQVAIFNFPLIISSTAAAYGVTEYPINDRLCL
jgi:hypothetical protein